MTQTEYEKFNAQYVRSEVKERAHPEVKYSFRNPSFLGRTGYMCKICEHLEGATGIYSAGGCVNSISSHIWKHRENGEW